MKISFLTTGHLPFDDRIFYHLGKTLAQNGHSVEIVSSKVTLNQVSEGISINSFNGDSLSKSEKMNYFFHLLSDFSPRLIICSEPLCILAASRYKKKKDRQARIAYDITEWYPPVSNISFLKIIFIKQLLLNFWSSFCTDSFIFGDWYKSRPYRFLFPFKPFVFITYYPDLTFFRETEPPALKEKMRLTYSGNISRTRGFLNFMNVVRGLSDRHKNLSFEIKVIGWFETEKDKSECEPFLKETNKNIAVKLTGRQTYIAYIEHLINTDIFIDLRDDNFENSYSLPIKLFNYLAVGRPVIYSVSKAVRDVVEFEKFGHLVKPGDTESITRLVSGYIDNRELYIEHCRNARRAAEEKYNWGKISPALIQFVGSLYRGT